MTTRPVVTDSQQPPPPPATRDDRWMDRHAERAFGGLWPPPPRDDDYTMSRCHLLLINLSSDNGAVVIYGRPLVLRHLLGSLSTSSLGSCFPRNCGKCSNIKLQYLIQSPGNCNALNFIYRTRQSSLRSW